MDICYVENGIQFILTHKQLSAYHVLCFPLVLCLRKYVLWVCTIRPQTMKNQFQKASKDSFIKYLS